MDSDLMNDLIGLAVLIIVVVCGLLGLAQLTAPRSPMSSEEFERRVKEGPGLLSAGVIGLQKILEPGAAKAVAVQEKLRGRREEGAQPAGNNHHSANDSTVDKHISPSHEASEEVKLGSKLNV